MKIEKRDDGVISDDKIVQVVCMNHLVEVQYIKNRNRNMPIKRLDKDTYLHLETGEIKEFNHTTNRSQCVESLRKTFKQLRYAINYNFVGAPNELFVTLTYAENMTDTKRLKRNFEDFIKNLRRKYKNTTIDFINVVEPQERGAWHCHVLFRFNDLDKIFISNDDMRSLWKQGFVTVRSMENVDNIGAYLSAYLADIELTPETVGMLKTGDEVSTKMVDGVEKRFIKGGRLHMYPTDMRIWRPSRGIKKPTKEFMKQGEIKKVVGNATPHYSQTITVTDDDKKVLNTIIYNQYNLKRQILQSEENNKKQNGKA